MTSRAVKDQTRLGKQHGTTARSDAQRVNHPGDQDSAIEDPAIYADHASNESRLHENRWRGFGTQLPEDDMGPTTKDPMVGRTYGRQPQDTRHNG